MSEIRSNYAESCSRTTKTGLHYESTKTPQFSLAHFSAILDESAMHYNAEHFGIDNDRDFDNYEPYKNSALVNKRRAAREKNRCRNILYNLE